MRDLKLVAAGAAAAAGVYCAVCAYQRRAVRRAVFKLLEEHGLFTDASTASGIVAPGAVAFHPSGVKIDYVEGQKAKSGAFKGLGTEILDVAFTVDATVAHCWLQMREKFELDGEKHDDLAFLTLGLSWTPLSGWVVTTLQRTHGTAATEAGTGKLGGKDTFRARK
jgi:hypothetical protein